MFFRALAALIAADAVDRRMRERQLRAWLAAETARAAARPAQPAALWPAPGQRDSRDPQRPA
jgi:hypothetical protein